MQIQTNEGMIEIDNKPSCYLCDNCDSHRNHKLEASKIDGEDRIYICSYHVSDNDYDEGWVELDKPIKNN